jgi:acyl-CoA synthetase (AMP-forming)/AMP-acid ligase II
MLIGDYLRRSAIHFPQKEALKQGNRVLTYRELNGRVNRLAHGLLKIGAKKGDRIAVLLHNCMEQMEIYFACAKTGIIFIPINNLLRQSELRFAFDYVTPRGLFLDLEFEKLVEPMRKDLNYLEFFVGFKGSCLEGALEYENLLKRGHPTEPEAEVSDRDVSSIFFTSGTTGRPKGVMRTHHHEIMNAMTNAVELRMQYDERALLLFPFYHIPFVDNTLRFIMMASTIVIRREDRFNAREVLDIISREKITVCQFVPTMINAMLQEENIEAYDLSHFRLLIYVGSTIPVAVLRRAMERIPCRFFQFYGGSESGPATTALRPDDHVLEGSKSQLARLASAGRAVLGYEVRIVDEDDNDLPVGDVGEIVVQSDAMMMGYWNLPEETSKTLKGGWLHTGDMGRVDEEGYVYIVDRKNDMIISGGKNIYPREIEEWLYRHPAILEAVVIGVPDDYWGESVKAVVVLKDGTEGSEEEIITYCKENLASYKKPRSVEFRKELPKNPAGKILKRLIKDEYWKDRDRKV